MMVLSRTLLTTAVVLGVAATVPTSAWAKGDVAAGKAVFLIKCRKCHGDAGQGNPAMAKMLKVEIKHLGTPGIQKKSDEELKKQSQDGIGKMKPVEGLSPADLENVIAFVRTLKQ